MSYSAKTNWALNDAVMPTDMNRIEVGILSHDNRIYLMNTIFPATATGNAYSILITAGAITSMADLVGIPLKIKPNADSTGAATLNPNSLGAHSIKKANGGEVSNLKSGGVYTVTWDGVNFQLLGEGGEYGTVTQSDVLEGVSFGTEDGIKLGTIPSKSAQTYTPSQSTQTIASGQYLSGEQTISAVPVDATKVLTGTTIAGKAGTMPNQGTKIITPSTVNQAIAGGYHSGSGYVEGDADLVGANIVSGKSIFGVAGSAVLEVPFMAGDVLVAQPLVNSLQGCYTSSPVKVLEFVINKSGTFRVYFGMLRWNAAASGTGYGQIYKNGVPYGTQRSWNYAGIGVVSGGASSPEAGFTEDLTFSRGDLLQFYGWISASEPCYFYNISMSVSPGTAIVAAVV